MPREFGEQSNEEMKSFGIRNSPEGKFIVLLPLDAAMASYPTEGMPKKISSDGVSCVEVSLNATTREEAEEEVSRAFDSMDESLG